MSDYIKTITIELSEYEHLKKCSEENAFLYIDGGYLGYDRNYVLCKKEDVVQMLIDEISKLRQKNSNLGGKLIDARNMSVRDFKVWRNK